MWRHPWLSCQLAVPSVPRTWRWALLDTLLLTLLSHFIVPLSFLFLFLSALLHLLHVLPFHYPLKIFSYTFTFVPSAFFFFLAKSSLYSSPSPQINFTHARASSPAQDGYHGNPFSGTLPGVCYCSITHCHGSWLTLFPFTHSVFYSPLTLNTRRHTHTHTHTHTLQWSIEHSHVSVILLDSLQD